jgi:hypothetical protein
MPPSMFGSSEDLVPINLVTGLGRRRRWRNWLITSNTSRDVWARNASVSARISSAFRPRRWGSRMSATSRIWRPNCSIAAGRTLPLRASPAAISFACSVRSNARASGCGRAESRRWDVSRILPRVDLPSSVAKGLRAIRPGREPVDGGHGTSAVRIRGRIFERLTRVDSSSLPDPQRMTGSGRLRPFLPDVPMAPITVIQWSPASALNRTFRQARLVTEMGGEWP